VEKTVVVERRPREATDDQVHVHVEHASPGRRQGNTTADVRIGRRRPVAGA
jgi:hypothetical protein